MSKQCKLLSDATMYMIVCNSHHSTDSFCKVSCYHTFRNKYTLYCLIPSRKESALTRMHLISLNLQRILYEKKEVNYLTKNIIINYVIASMTHDKFFPKKD